MRKFETSQKEDSRAQTADSSKAYTQPSRAFYCTLFACFLLFQPGKNRMQLNYRVRRCGVKNQNCRQEVLNRGFNFREGPWHSESLIKSFLNCSVSYLNLEGLSPPMTTVATGLVWISLMLSLLKYVQRNKKLQSSNQVMLNITQWTVKNVLSFLLHNKIIYEFITICLAKFVTFNVPNA